MGEKPRLQKSVLTVKKEHKRAAIGLGTDLTTDKVKYKLYQHHPVYE